MNLLSAYLSLFSQPLVPPPDAPAPDDLESSSPSSSSHPHPPHPKASSSQEEYEPVELGTIPTRPGGMLFRARSSFMKMVGATRDAEAEAEAAGLNATAEGGAGGGSSRERSGSMNTRSYGSTGITENGLGAITTERPPNVGGRRESSREVHHVIGEEPEDDGKWMRKQRDGVRL
ncbi:hypothetical protein BDY24DRAFT_385320 [Mrakia frigida]|uniref:uncharacterized protein n=1 Tax=Mrakia frigida TaxID=29902 RepID=UPI003FCBFCDF